MQDGEVRFGLIGYGLFGAHHASAIASAAGASLAAISAKSAASQEKARQDHPTAEVYGDYRELLVREDIDIVNIVTPNLLHFEMGMAALAAGKHVLMEKPLATELPQCDALLAEAKRLGKLLAVGHELRLSSLWGAAKRIIEEGKIGRPRYALIELSRFPYRPGAEGWRYDAARVGNWILEEPIHFFDLARWYMQPCGEPVSVYARANARRADRPDLLDNFSATLNFADGGYAVVSQTLAAFGHHVTAKVSGEEGALWVRWGAADARSDKPVFDLRYGMGDEVHEEPFAESTGELVELAAEIAAIARSVREGAAAPCTGEDGHWSALLCLAAQQSVDSGRVVKINEFRASFQDA